VAGPGPRGTQAGGVEAEAGLHGEIVVAGSIRLVRTLVETIWVDELRLMIYPVVLDAGERLFAATSDKGPVRLAETRSIDDLAYLAYEVDRVAA
jgi:dihydrofolate reductase